MLGLEVAAVVLSLLVLGAHFLRAGCLLLVLVPFALIGLLFVRRPWVARVVQVVLVLGAAEWVRTLLGLARQRMQAGEPVLRMTIILGVVAAVSLAAAIAFSRGHLGRLYGLRPPPSEEDGS